MIRRIAIKNFRSLNVDVELDPVTVLIGRSGTGKTNFVDALRYLRQVLQNGYLQAELQNGTPNGDGNVFPLTKKDNEMVLEYEIEFDVPPLSEKFCYSLAASSKRAVVSERFTIDDQSMISQEISPNSPRFQFSSFQGNQKVSIARIALTQGLACYDFPGSVCVGGNSNETGGLLDRGENFNNVFNTISKDLTKLESWNMINRSLQNLNSTVETISFNSRNEQEILVTHKFDNHSVSFDIGKESEGFRRFFAHLLALYQTPPKQTLVFEEPERGIHPGALQSLAEALKRCSEEKRGQVILTTHNPQLLDHFEPESIRVVEMHNGETRIGRIAIDQLESIRESLLFPGELLTVTDAKMDESVPISEEG